MKEIRLHRVGLSVGEQIRGHVFARWWMYGFLPNREQAAKMVRKANLTYEFAFIKYLISSKVWSRSFSQEIVRFFGPTSGSSIEEEFKITSFQCNFTAIDDLVIVKFFLFLRVVRVEIYVEGKLGVELESHQNAGTKVERKFKGWF